MNILDTYRPMNIWVMPPSHNLSENKGAIPFYNKANMKLRFATSSEFSFQVPKKYYDERIEQWVDNELYDKLDKNTVLFTDWENQVNSVATHYIPTDDSYYKQSYNRNYGKYENVNFVLKNDEKIITDNVEHSFPYVEDSGELYYIVATEPSSLLVDGIMYAGVDNLKTAGYEPTGLFADSTYYEVHNGDTVYFNSYPLGSDAGMCAIFKAYIYSTKDETTVIDEITKDGGLFATTINGRYYEINLEKHKLEKAYIRFSIYNYTKSSGTYEISPIRIYSSRRYVQNYNIINSSTKSILSCQYWVVKDISIENNLLMPIKTITAYSYDYVLKNRYITLVNNVLNLYTPPKIKNLIDTSLHTYGISTDIELVRQQLAVNGIINQILEILPNWSMGYISSSLVSKYRTFSDTESLNLYTLLTETIPFLWNCFVILDTKNLTINIFDKEDTLLENDLVLSFNNAVKSSTISSEDTDIVTALHIGTNDNTYYINLVNPTGDDVIYDFSYYSNDLENYIGSSGVSLWKRVCDWQDGISNSTEKYRNEAKLLIEYNQEMVRLESKLEVAKSNYLAKIKIINITSLGDSNNRSYIIFSEQEVTDVAILEKYSTVFYDKEDIREQIISLAKEYWSIKEELDKVKSKYKSRLLALNTFNRMNNIKGKKHVKNESGVTQTVLNFNPDEYAYLSNFITEGHWTDENAVFSEDYSTEDIYDTLTSTYDKAKSDMSTYIAKPSYDVNISLANIMLMSEYKDILKTMYLGSYGYVEAERGVWEQSVLLEIDIDFDNKENCAFMFSTNYKRKPLEMRFRDLFDQISKVSVTNNSYTYDDSASTTETLEVAETAETTIE